ncbi:MAG: (2Fe-2S)-binding protein [Saprospiraceae bacterium]
MKLTINGQEREINVEESMPLLWVLRDELNMTGTKYGCGVSYCGACSVLIDGVATRTCTLPVVAAEGKTITTIEGISTNGNMTAVQRAWIQHQVPQCGYCQSGQIIAAEALLDSIPNPTNNEIDNAMTNICRCGTYQRVREAIHSAAKMRKRESERLD